MITDSNGLSTFEIIEKVATIIIAAGTLFFSYIIYRYQLRKDNTTLRLDWYKVIIIESKFSNFFDFFSYLNEKLKPLNEDMQVTIEERQKINADILEKFARLEADFISLLLAVDNMLYICVKHQFDDLVDGITIKLGDESLNWESTSIFEDEIASHMALQKTVILKLFVEFKGKTDSHLNPLNKIKEWFD